ncbi:MAG: hypothetical protein IPP55_21135 [Anaerolineales bacterium]|nr:hypothetical protein [Anaerolineales bacterium]
MSQTSSTSLESAVLETLAYSDVFDYPLTLGELHRYLTCLAEMEEMQNRINILSAVGTFDGYYFLSHRRSIVGVRREREAASRSAFKRAIVYGRLLGVFPFVRMVALTGSLAVLNLSKDADMDYMLITQPGRLWLARAFVVTFGRFMRLFGDRICVNLLISKSALAWHSHDLYSAREMCQMIPITGMEVYFQLRQLNVWIKSFLPNAESFPVHTPVVKEVNSLFQKSIEFFFRGKIGDILEAWAMKFQTRKIARTYGTGPEAIFSVDLCQGNFHNHHSLTDQSFRERLDLLVERENRS